MPPQRFGLLGIRERAEHFGGRLDVRSAPGRGTQVLLALPRAPLPHRNGTTKVTKSTKGAAPPNPS
jgi:signal transduction histidine kinase